MPETPFWCNWEFYIQSLIAIGTVGAVIVALFGNWLRQQVLPAKLHLSIRDNEALKTVMAMHTGPGNFNKIDAYWYHIRVKNSRRHVPVHAVRVFITKISEKNAAGQYDTTWSGEIPIKWRDGELYPSYLNIGPHMDSDLCSVTGGGQNSKKVLLRLHPVQNIFSLKSEYEGETSILLQFQARGKEIDSEYLNVEIAWNGKISTDEKEMSKNLVVTRRDTVPSHERLS